MKDLLSPNVNVDIKRETILSEWVYYLEAFVLSTTTTQILTINGSTAMCSRWWKIRMNYPHDYNKATIATELKQIVTFRSIFIKHFNYNCPPGLHCEIFVGRFILVLLIQHYKNVLMWPITDIKSADSMIKNYFDVRKWNLPIFWFFLVSARPRWPSHLELKHGWMQNIYRMFRLWKSSGKQLMNQWNIL